MHDRIKVSVDSEIGELNGVIMHTPGSEVENMTPMNAQRALYSDILNLSVARREYAQLYGVLSKVARTYQVSDLLLDVLNQPQARENLVKHICWHENATPLRDDLLKLAPRNLAQLLIEGVPLQRNTLTSFLSQERFSLAPLYNFYFTRDAAFTVNNNVFVGKMANRVRHRESLIMEAIFNSSGRFETSTINPMLFSDNTHITIEGGDVLVARRDILLVGSSCRTTTRGIDFIINRIIASGVKGKTYVLVQELPEKPESFIHLDMVFTLLNTDECMVFEPIVLRPSRYQTVQITIDNGKVADIRTVENLLIALSNLGMPLKPIACGGTIDSWTQEREQWHSGANFFAFGPGRVIGYSRNVHTVEEMSRNGYEIIRAKDVVAGRVDPLSYQKCLVSIDGSELPRGGGGARCMTMPVSRQAVSW